MKGQDLVGLAYDGPFDERRLRTTSPASPADAAYRAQKQNWASGPVGLGDLHRVIAWNDVGETEGTGIVHIAPGCGKEDFLLGKEHGLPPVAPLDEFGVFLPGFGPEEGKPLSNRQRRTSSSRRCKGKGVLFAVEKYPHSYPHCWRCKTEVLFRLVDEWFIGMSWA